VSINGGIAAPGGIGKKRGDTPAPQPEPEASSGLTAAQYEALRPRTGHQRYDSDIAFDAEFEMEATPQGRDVLEMAREFQTSFVGYEGIQADVWRLTTGRDLPEDRRRRTQALLDATRNAPSDLVPDMIYRGIGVDDIEEFEAGHQPGAVVDVGPSSFSSSRSVAKKFSAPDDTGAGANPVIFEVDTTAGVQALPLENMSDRASFDHREVLAMGRFRVISADRASSGGALVVRLEPVASF
jgi:hypothetical protein